ncbi:MAG: aspartate/glutamate racemase family protein [Comamonadaceae bacterium]|nr:MAG: aspartate/glutamate racemase family protein [Comamonadaceae bacterium]
MRIPHPATVPGAATSPGAAASGFLGLLMLDTGYPCLPGDIAHPDAFPAHVPVSRRLVRGAWPQKVLQSNASLRAARVLPAFVFVVQAMQRDGALAITTNCSFLVLLQKELQAAVKVPVVTSSLMLLPELLAREGTVGVLAMSAASVGTGHLRMAGVPRDRLKDVAVQGVEPRGEFARVILGNLPQVHVGKAAADLVAAAMALKQREPSLQSLVLEHPAMSAHRQAIEAATNLKTCALNDDERLLNPWRPGI